MPVKKPDKWKEDAEAAIKEGKTFEEVTKELTGKYGDEAGKIGASTYGKLRKLAFPEEKLSEVVGKSQDARREEKKKKVFPVWTPQKQKAGDESQLAKVLNDITFLAIPCPSGELKLEDIQQINMGGGIVNVVQYAFPSIDLGNPVLILVLRMGLLFVKVKKLCYDIKRKIGGINPLYTQKPTAAAPTPKPTPLTEVVSEHPSDVYLREHGLLGEQQEK